MNDFSILIIISLFAKFNHRLNMCKCLATVYTDNTLLTDVFNTIRYNQ